MTRLPIVTWPLVFLIGMLILPCPPMAEAGPGGAVPGPGLCDLDRCCNCRDAAKIDKTYHFGPGLVDRDVTILTYQVGDEIKAVASIVAL